MHAICIMYPYRVFEKGVYINSVTDSLSVLT